MPTLAARIGGGDLVLEPLADAHRAGLRAACAADAEVWGIYVRDWGPAGFDASFDGLLADPGRHGYAILHRATLAGMTAWIGHDPARGTVEIGNSYLAPHLRGTGINRAVKRLMLGHAFARGIRRVEFRIDERNARSKAAVERIGAVREGSLRAERITWTGHVRDTALYAILAEEWD